MPECILSDCKSGRAKSGEENVQMFKFPTETTARNRWLRHCNLGKNIRKDARICAKHFKKNCFLTPYENVDDQNRPRTKSRLKVDAVPTVFSFRPTPKSFKRKRIGSEKAVDTNLEISPNISKKPRKSVFNEHSYCYNFPKLPNENSEDTLYEGNRLKGIVLFG